MEGRKKPKVKLIGEDGNAFAILARAKVALQKQGASKALIDQYMEEAMAGDYNHLLRTTMKYCDVY